VLVIILSFLLIELAVNMAAEFELITLILVYPSNTTKFFHK
jgi:hypothetical protein